MNESNNLEYPYLFDMLPSLNCANKQIRNNSKQKLHKINRLGGGTYGRVYQASEQSIPGTFIPVNSSETVAIKRNFISPNLHETIGSVREMDILNLVRDHPYCIQLHKVYFETPFADGALSPIEKYVSDKAFFELEKGDMDGERYIHQKDLNVPLVNERKLFAVQIFLGIEFMHSRGVYHRDLKPANIICFLNSSGQLDRAKIADFGLTQYYSNQSMSIPGLVTLWYRAPEIALLKEYDFKIDVWSLGCILFELFSCKNQRFIQPDEDERLINMLIDRLSFPREDYILAQQLYPRKITRLYNSLQKNLTSIREQLELTPSQIAQFNSSSLGGYPNSGIFNNLVDLLEHMLVVDPDKRYTISECLNHPFFDGFRELIDKTRTAFGISHAGEWVLQPTPKFIYANNSVRSLGMKWFQIVYSNRLSAPICNWYSHRILFHALEMYDRYLILANISDISESVSESDVVVWINTFLFIATKYFRVMVQEFGLNYFTVGIIPEEFCIFQSRVQKFEEQVIRDIFNLIIYRPTIYEIADDFLTENSVLYLLKILMSNKLESGISLERIWSDHLNALDEANRTPSPLASPGTPVISILDI